MTEKSIETKNPPHRPLKYKSVEDMQAVIDKYFLVQDDKDKPFTISGLCLALDINMDTFYEWEENLEKGFSETIKKARLRIIEQDEQMLKSKYALGAIFHLKNIARKHFNDKFGLDVPDNSKGEVTIKWQG